MTSDWRARLARVDVLAPLSSAVALAVYLAHGLDGGLSRDPALYAYAGQRFADGIPPYVGVLNRAGPLAHALPGVGVLAARGVGADDLLGIRVVFLLLATACVGLTYVLGRSLFQSRLAGLAAASALLCFQGFIHLAAQGPREKTAMVLFLIAAMLAVVHRRWVTTGVLIALATLTWQPVFVAALPGAVAAVLVGLPSGRARALARIALGGLVPTALIVGAYAAIGELRLFLDDFLLINLRYTQQEGFLAHPELAWGRLVDGYGGSLVVLVVGVLALLGLTVAAAARWRGLRDPRTAGLVGVGVALVGAILWTGRAYDSWPDLFLFLPLAAIGVGGLAAELARRLPRAAVGVTVAWCLVAVAMSFDYAVAARNYTLLHQRASVAAVLEVVPDARMLSISAPEPLVLAGKRNPSRVQLFGHGLVDYLDDTWPGGVEGYGRWITDEERPLLIMMGSSAIPSWLEPRLRETYVRVGRTPSWRWFVRRDAPQPVREGLRAALAAVPAVEG